MSLPVQITYHKLSPTDPIEARIRAGARRLQKKSPSLTGVRVVVDAPHRRRVHHYCVRLQLRRWADSPMFVQSSEHTDLYDAIDEAFETAERRISQRRRGRESIRHAHTIASAKGGIRCYSIQT